MIKYTYPLILAALLATVPCALTAHAQSVDINVSGGSIPGLPSFLGGGTTIDPTTVGGGNPTSAGNIAGSLASPNAGGPTGSTFSGGTTGVFGNTTSATGTGQMSMPVYRFNNPTAQQNPGGLQSSGMGLMSPGSVDQSSLPSGQWKYGFSNGGTGLYQGVSGGSIGGFLPATSTASNDFNTVDCPFIRGPLGGGSGSGLGNINFNIPLPGGVNVGGSVNTQQAINGLQNFFGN